MDKHGIQNTTELRSQNKKAILEVLYKYGVMTKRGLAEYTKLSLSTISTLCNHLEQDGLIKYSSTCASSGGRMPQAITLCEDGRYILCINLIAADSVHIVLTNISGACIAEYEEKVREDDYKNILEACARGLSSLLEKTSCDKSLILGATVAIPGIQDRVSSRVVNSTVSALENRPLQKDLRAILGTPVYVENESNLMAFALLTDASNDEAVQDLVFIYVGEGIGTGIMHAGRLYTGAKGYGGEISHIPIGRRGYHCYCGQHGCVETELSINGFVRKYNELAAEQIDDALPAQTQWDAYVSAVKRKDDAALNVLIENGRILGVLSTIMINLLDPEKLVLGGYVSDIFDEILPYVEREISSHLAVQRPDGVPVYKGASDRVLIIGGCVRLVMAQWMP